MRRTDRVDLLLYAAWVAFGLLMLAVLTGCGAWNDTRTPRQIEEQRQAGRDRMVQWCDVRGGHKDCRMVPESEVRRVLDQMSRQL